MAIPSWLHIEPTSGVRPVGDSVNVRIVADAHTGRADRRYTLTAKTTNGTTATLPITQTAADAFINIEGIIFNSKAKSNTMGIYEIDTMPAAGTEFELDILVTSNCKDLRLQALSGGNISPLTDVFESMQLYSSQKTYTAETLVEEWSHADPTGTYGNVIPGDPGADAEYKYTIRINNITENQKEYSRELQIYVTSLADSKQVTAENYIHIVQNPGVKTYSTPVATIKYNDIKASGSSSADLPIITDTKQTWGWNGNTSNGGTITDGFTYTYALADSSIKTFKVDSTTGLISGVASLGTTAKAKTPLGGVKVTVDANGESSTVTAGVIQEANTVSYEPIVYHFLPQYQGEDETGVVNVSSSEGYKIPRELFAYDGYEEFGISQTKTYTSGASAENYFNEVGKWNNGTCSFSITTPIEGFSADVHEDEKCISYSENYSSQARNGCVVTITIDASKDDPANPAKATILVTFNQAAGGSTITLNPTTIEFVDAGGSKTLTITTNDGWTLS